ncbi:hypothetical protein E4P29_02425 [Rhodococcus sp. 1R11]|uniref:hypothetical protein n=1 Tax=Rhodococcus sp. 1R11 TaxID=2559614 RepID=UPI0010717772|nr:hypothetical protein [Rhodococcus sp. 1R11]TFI45819.1 hypothetical protein E4P29_02425 [Rhodococcus sp. 1R11]
MNDSCGFALSCSSPKDMITRLQFGTADLWPENAALPVRWRYMADLVDSDRGVLAELDGSVSTPVSDALAAAAELCRQSADEPVPAGDWALLGRALAWLGSGGSDIDRALVAVGEELTLIGLDGAEQDFSIATWLCMDVLVRFATAGGAIEYWVLRVNASGLKKCESQKDSESCRSGDAGRPNGRCRSSHASRVCGRRVLLPRLATEPTLS